MERQSQYETVARQTPHKKVVHIVKTCEEIFYGQSAMGAVANTSELLALFRSRWPIAQWEQTGYFSEEFLHKINPYWMRFPPPDPQSHYALAIIYAVVMTIGVTGNSLVICMFIRRRSLRTPSNILVMNLAVSDFFLLIKMPVFIFNCLQRGPALGELGCQIYGFLGGLTGTVSIMTLAAIALDRYHVIVHPLDRKARQRIYLTVLLLWLYGATFATLPLLDIGFNHYVPEGYLTSCSFDYLSKDLKSRAMIFVFFCAAWVVPLCIICFCYFGICRAVLRVRTESVNTESSRHCKEADRRRTELKVAGIVLGIVMLWVVSWTPYAVVALLGVTGHEDYLTPFTSMVPALFCKFASCADPFVYAVTHPRFRLELKTMVRHVSAKQRRKSQKRSSVQMRRRSSDVEEVVVMMDLREESMYTLTQFNQPGPASLTTTPHWHQSQFYPDFQARKSSSMHLSQQSNETTPQSSKERITV